MDLNLNVILDAMGNVVFHFQTPHLDRKFVLPKMRAVLKPFR